MPAIYPQVTSLFMHKTVGIILAYFIYHTAICNSYNTSVKFVSDLSKQRQKVQPQGSVLTNQIQTEWMCYICFMVHERIKGTLSCVWHEKQIYTTGPLLWSGVGDLADGKPWISMPLN